MRKISSTFLSSFCSFSVSAESVAALRTLLPGTGAVLHSAEVPTLLTANAGRCEVSGQKLSYFSPINLLMQRARMNAGLFSRISNYFIFFLRLFYLFGLPSGDNLCEEVYRGKYRSSGLSRRCCASAAATSLPGLYHAFRF